MKFTPHMLGAVAVVAIAGAVSGATIGDTPVLSQGLTETIPDAPIVSASNAKMRNTERLPDHYPLKTPNGTIEVAELSLHGRMRDRGGDMLWVGRDKERAHMNTEYDFYETASAKRIEHEHRLLAFLGKTAAHAKVDREASQQATTKARMSRAEAPMALAEPAEIAPPEPAVQRADTESIGNSRTVDVTAALASRD